MTGAATASGHRRLAGLGEAAAARRLARCVGLEDVRRAARRRLPRALFDYVDGAADDEVTARRNRSDFHAVGLRHDIATWVEPDLCTRVLGRELALPVLTAPCGGMRVIHPVGDVGVARAARDRGTVHVVSSASGHRLEEVVEQVPDAWFQLYTLKGREMMESLVHRAAASGYDVLVVTSDTAANGNRERDIRNGFSLAMDVNLRTAVRMGPQLAIRPGWVRRFVGDGMAYDLANTATTEEEALSLTAMATAGSYSMSPTWDDIAWIREQWRGRMVVKGLTSAEDARRAADAGADGVIVSNHGGRQLDGVPSTISVLPSVVDAVGERVDVLLDSGVRRGTDVVKALALGAKAVLIGRPAAFGLATGGEAGVRHVLEVLEKELRKSMQIMGCASVTDLDRSWVVRP